jgi:hypothetical protein
VDKLIQNAQAKGEDEEEEKEKEAHLMERMQLTPRAEGKEVERKEAKRWR